MQTVYWRGFGQPNAGAGGGGKAGNGGGKGGNGQGKGNGNNGNGAGYVGNNYRDAVLADGPWAYWRMNETSGTAAINTGSTSGINGIYQGGYTLGGPALVRDAAAKSVLFSGLGAAGKMNGNQANSFDTVPWGAEVVCRAAASGFGTRGFLIGQATYFATTQSTFPISIFWDPADNRIKVSLGRTGSWSAFFTLQSAVLTRGVNYHVFFNFNPNTSGALYINGVLAASGVPVGDINNSGVNYSAGGAATENGVPAGDSRFSGYVAEAALYYNKNLSLARIQAHAALLA